jgi:lysophospholipase L1-like esterase
MLDCLILGDSIAVGTAQVRKECVSYSTGGYNSWQWNKTYNKKDLNAKTVIISLGSNDHTGVRTVWELQQLRVRVKADHVFWIMPAIKPDVQKMVRTVAESYGDTIIPITRLQPDGIHPSLAGYKNIAESTKNDTPGSTVAVDRK